MELLGLICDPTANAMLSSSRDGFINETTHSKYFENVYLKKNIQGYIFVCLQSNCQLKTVLKCMSSNRNISRFFQNGLMEQFDLETRLKGISTTM